MARLHRINLPKEKLSDEDCLAAITFKSLFEPVLKVLENQDRNAATILRESLSRAESEGPGFLLQFVRTLLQKADLNTVDLNETVLRVQLHLPEDNFASNYSDLSHWAIQLKNSLSRMPDIMVDRNSFIKHLRELAGNMESFLKSIDTVSKSMVDQEFVRSIERSKRDFIADSRHFKETLLSYFSNQGTIGVFASANRLIYHMTVIIETLRQYSNKSQLPSSNTSRNSN